MRNGVKSDNERVYTIGGKEGLIYTGSWGMDAARKDRQLPVDVSLSVSTSSDRTTGGEGACFLRDMCSRQQLPGV